MACVWAVFFGDAAHFQKQGEKAFDADKIKAFLSEKGIASCPTVLKAIREHGNASDKFLKVIETVDLAAVLAQMPECRHLCTTGGKATEVLLEIQGSGMKMPKAGETVPFPYAGRGVDPDALAFDFACLSFEFGEKSGGVSGFF